jgi:hypothetical protein
MKRRNKRMKLRKKINKNRRGKEVALVAAVVEVEVVKMVGRQGSRDLKAVSLDLAMEEMKEEMMVVMEEKNHHHAADSINKESKT